MLFNWKWNGSKKTDKVANSNPPGPWREPLNEDLGTLREKIERYDRLPSLGVSQARILMIGPVGAGKSSLCNTLSAIFSDRMTHLSPVGSTGQSFTKVYRQYHIRSHVTDNNLKFCLCDTRGIEDGKGLILEDIKYLLEGSVPDGYEFHESVPINPNFQGFRKRPGLEDQVHCVAFVIDASSAEGLGSEVWDKLKNVQHEISKRGISRVVLLTKVDLLCTGGDISKVFESSQVGNALRKVSEMLGISPHHVHPIKNYEHELLPNDEVNRLALTALEQMITFANDVLEQKCRARSSITPWRQPPPDLNRETMQNLMERIKKYTPPSDLGIPFARILMVGPVDAGKSSFFNTLNSVFTGRITQIINGATTAYRQYQIQPSVIETALRFRLCDTSGVERNPFSYLTDLMYVIDGNVPDGYKFNSSSPIFPANPGFNIEPGLKDKVHCVVFVFDGSTIDAIADSTWEKLLVLQARLASMDLPRAVLLTNIDKISQTLHDDISSVFRSEDVDASVQKGLTRYSDDYSSAYVPSMMFAKDTTDHPESSNVRINAAGYALQSVNDDINMRFVACRSMLNGEENVHVQFRYPMIVEMLEKLYLTLKQHDTFQKSHRQ